MTRTTRTSQTTHSTNQAALYLRVSTEEQSREGVSLAAQEATLRSYCALRGLEVVELVCDAGVSGGKALESRVGGRRILDLIKRGGVRHIVTYKLDRLFRNCADCLTVTAQWDKKGVALHLVDIGGQTLDTSTAMGRFFLTVMAGAAELERNLVAERTTEAMAYKRAQGERVGEVPYGFTVSADGKTLVSDATEQVLVGAIREARQRGLTQRAIVTELTHKGFTTRKGTALSLMQVQRIMRQAAIA